MRVLILWDDNEGYADCATVPEAVKLLCRESELNSKSVAIKKGGTTAKSGDELDFGYGKALVVPLGKATTL